MVEMGCKESSSRLTTQGHPPTIRQFGGVEREKDSHGQSKDYVLTKHLESPDITPTLSKQLGGHKIGDP